MLDILLYFHTLVSRLVVLRRAVHTLASALDVLLRVFHTFVSRLVVLRRVFHTLVSRRVIYDVCLTLYFLGVSFHDVFFTL